VKSLIQVGYNEKQFGGVIFGSKLTLNHPSNKKKKKKGVTTRVIGHIQFIFAVVNVAYLIYLFLIGYLLSFLPKLV